MTDKPTHPETHDALSELARVKAIFQQRTLLRILSERPDVKREGE